MNDNNMTGGQRLQALVLRLELTIRELANIANMSEATFYHITDGTRGISERVASRVCYNLETKRGVTVNRQWLLTGGSAGKDGVCPSAGDAEPSRRHRARRDGLEREVLHAAGAVQQSIWEICGDA